MDDDELPQLPADTLKLLEEFNEEKQKQTKRFEDLKNESENAFQKGDGNGKLSMDLFGEDW
jgi:EEF1A lysine methyltransferase 1